MATKKNVQTESSKIPLTEIVNQLRGELVALNKSAADHELKFALEEVEVELQVGLTWETGGKIGFNCWIYQAEGGGTANRETVQKVTLKLKPDGDGFVVSRRE